MMHSEEEECQAPPALNREGGEEERGEREGEEERT